MKKLLTGIAVASMAIAGLSGSASAAPAENSIYDTITTDVSFGPFTVADGTLNARILKAAGLDAGSINLGNCDSGAPQYTVFFPVYDALVAAVEKIGELEDGYSEAEFALALDALLADKATLRGLLALHVVSGTLTEELLLTDGYTNLPTLGGLNITKTVEDGSVYVNDFEVVYSASLSCNGAVHFFAGVIAPPTAPDAPSCGANYVGNCPAGTGTSGGGLPATGSESMALTYAALASLIAGAGVLVLRRRSVA